LKLRLHSLPVGDGVSGGTAGHTLGLVQIQEIHKTEKETVDGKSDYAPAVLLVHGAISNSRMFFSKNARGLGPYLARHGINVFICDLRGRGFSTPSIAAEQSKLETGNVSHGQVEAIREDLPAFAAAVQRISGRATQSWLAHSWGGVLLSSALAHSGQALTNCVDSMTFLGTKKYIGEKYSWDYAKNIAFGWNLFCPLVVKRHGYLPAARYGIGMDDETETSLSDCTHWVKSEMEWIDPSDGFDYLDAWNRLRSPPPTWHICGINDSFLGNPKCVSKFAKLTNQTEKFSILSKANGNLSDYEHNELVLSKQADEDHFPDILQWVLEHHSRTSKKEESK
jgi:predicted alpha/beta hydrolase